MRRGGILLLTIQLSTIHLFNPVLSPAPSPPPYHRAWETMRRGGISLFNFLSHLFNLLNLRHLSEIPLSSSASSVMA